jgi:hypothetical protein
MSHILATLLMLEPINPLNIHRIQPLSSLKTQPKSVGPRIPLEASSKFNLINIVGGGDQELGEEEIMGGGMKGVDVGI